jgi:hypothetical protein
MKKRIIILSLAMLLCLPISSFAGPITVDAGWYGFCFGGAGSPATAGCQNEGIGTTGNTFTFTAASSVLFKITDAFQAGDTFDVFINSAVVTFTTPAVATDGAATVKNPDLAFADPIYSHHSLLLAAGIYNIDVYANQSPFGVGGAYLEVETARAVPEPMTLLLLLAGLAGLCGMKKRD